MNLTLPQLVELAHLTGFPDPALAAAVAWAESGGNSCAQGDPNIGPQGYWCNGPNGSSNSFGLWQVYIKANPAYDPTWLLNPQNNARAAFAISSKGTSWRPWSTAWEDAKNQIGYLGPRAPFSKWYAAAQQAAPAKLPKPLDTPNIIPPRRLANRAPIVLTLVGAAALAAAAGYGTHYERQRLRRA